MRLFLAINFDAQTREHILSVQRRLRELGRGRFSHPENLHLTLVFLGEVEPERVASVRAAMDGVAVPPMELTFDQVGRFRRAGGDIWWLGLAPNRALTALQEELSGSLRGEGFVLENRLYVPHITLARQVRLQTEPDERALLGAPFTAKADAVSLMLSERVDGRLAYTPQYTVGAKAYGARGDRKGETAWTFQAR